MTRAQERLFILADEWLGVVLLTYLWRVQDAAFWPVFVTWAILVYGLSYPFHWRLHERVVPLFRGLV